MRTFIAIDLESGLKKNLMAFIDKLRPQGKDVKWTSAQGMHLTLKFLGETSDKDVLRMRSALDPVAKSHQSFDLIFQGTGVFPPGKKPPRVLWVGVLENIFLKQLQQKIEKEMEKLGFPREEREFHPHLTIGRVKIPFHLESLLQEMEKFKDMPFGEMSVSKLSFFQSILKPSGAEYHILSEFQLG